MSLFGETRRTVMMPRCLKQMLDRVAPRLRGISAFGLLPLLFFGCAVQQHVQTRGWLTSTTEMDISLMHHPLSSERYVEVSDAGREAAVESLRNVAWRPLTPQEARRYVDPARPPLDGESLILARAVRFTDRTYGISVYTNRGELFVLTGGMGSGQVQMERSAVVVAKKGRISRVYVEQSVDL